MSRVRSRNTGPEIAVRRILHALGYRFRLHDKRLPGCPDIVMRGLRSVIFVNGCYWHGHDCAKGRNTPKTNTQFWRDKIAKNVDRDRQTQLKLEELGWNVLQV